MIGTSMKALVFIRAATFALRFFAPLLVVALVLILVLDHEAHRLMLLLEILAIAEVAFYVLVYIPRSRAVQKPARYPPVLPREDRRRLFMRGHAQIADPEAFLSKWFQRAPLEEIRRENVKELFSYAFLNKVAWGPDDEDELDEYVDKLEELLGHKLAQGRGAATPLRLMVDPVAMQHRPLLWYMVVAAADALTYTYLTLSGFAFYRLSLSRTLTVFPFRLVTLGSRRTTPSQTLSYFATPHTSQTQLPILFLHGIGIGLWPYARFLRALHRANSASASGGAGQVGIIALELMPISSRITGELPSQEQLCADIAAILDRHGFDRVVVATHSFGSAVAAHMLHDPALAPRVASCLFVDPVAFLLHLPDVAWNFTRRPPQLPNEHIIRYFAAADPLIAHTVARRFFWAGCALWKEELQGRRVTAALSARDVVAPSLAVGRYLADDRSAYERFLTEEDEEDARDEEDPVAGRDAWQRTAWRGEGVDVLWYPRCDHEEIFDSKHDFLPLVDVLRSYSALVD